MQAGFQVADGTGDRGRFPQLRGAQYSAESSGARDARHVLFSGRPAAAHPYLAGADPRHARAQAADGADCAGAGVPQRLGHDAHADVPSGRRHRGRRERQLRELEGDAAHASSSVSSSSPRGCGCGRRISRSPSRRRRWISSACSAAARDAGCASRPAGSRSRAAE